VLVVYAVALRLGQTDSEARALTFATFLVANLGLIFTNRSWSRRLGISSLKDTALWAVTLSAVLFLALVIYVPPLAHLFRFAPLGPLDVALCFGAGALSVAWFELVKRSGPARPIAPSGSDPNTPAVSASRAHS